MNIVEQLPEARSDSTSAGVRELYRERLEVRRAAWKALEGRDLWLGYAKIASAAVGVILLWLAFGLFALSLWTLVPVVALFVGLALLHDRVIDAREKAQCAVAFYEQGIRRLEDRWIGAGTSGDRFADPQHPYAVDLDIFGHGSLYELLCTARTQIGEERFAAWLKEPGNASVVRERQQAVAELRPKLDLREEIASLGEVGLKGIDPDSLAKWGRDPVLLVGNVAPAAAILLGAATIAAAVFGFTSGGWIPFIALAVAGQVWEAIIRVRINQVIRAVDKPAADLQSLAGLLRLIERERYSAPLLQAVWDRVEIEGFPASARIARLAGRIDRLNARRNPAFAPIAALLLWATWNAFSIERWREENGPLLAGWLDAVGDFEALCSLAGYAYERPADPFPVIEEDGIRYEGRGLRHPLIPEERAVPNDVILGDSARVWIVSGSNMSGKSTLLRTVGVNAVLALAGAPVRAESLRIGALGIGASIRTLDSLLGGVSRFYAEVLRLRQIVEMAESGPLLFLLDEILHGTNSHDRLIGAEAVVRALVQKGAVGLVTTHDLALARIADEPDSGAANVHFQDHLEDGEMRFDYRLQPGVVTKSNALELMRSVGLEV